ncbi:MAG: hypothetical protein Q4D98_10980 [Planctomycetia bacterium]|nr:hypothetical protein [Planctomycetia bacterium]
MRHIRKLRFRRRWGAFLAASLLFVMTTGGYAQVPYANSSTEVYYDGQVISDVPLADVAATDVPAAAPSTAAVSPAPAEVPDSVITGAVPQSATVPAPAVTPNYPQPTVTLHDHQAGGTEYGVTATPGGRTTSPGYPRERWDGTVPHASHSAELRHENPKTRDETVPERVGQRPPLAPYDQQENYSYFTQTSTSNSTVCQHCGEGYGNPYMWLIDAKVKVYHRQRQEDTAEVLTDYADSAIAQIIDGNTNFRIGTGLDLGITRYLGRNSFNYDIWGTFRFDGLYNWNETENFTAYGQFESIYGIAGLNSFSYTVTENGTENQYLSLCQVANRKCTSHMNMGEIMFKFAERGRPDPLVISPNGRWTRQCQGGLRYSHTAGFRFTAFDDSIYWNGTGYQYLYDAENETYTATGLVDYTAKVDIECQNRLVGLSLGGEMVDKHCIWSWGFNWRFTPLINFSESTFEYASTSGAYQRIIEDKTDVGYQVELGIFARIKIRPHLILSMGYDLNFIGNLVVAGNNTALGVNGEINIDNREYLLFQGFTIGTTWVW